MDPSNEGGAPRDTKITDALYERRKRYRDEALWKKEVVGQIQSVFDKNGKESKTVEAMLSKVFPSIGVNAQIAGNLADYLETEGNSNLKRPLIQKLYTNVSEIPQNLSNMSPSTISNYKSMTSVQDRLDKRYAENTRRDKLFDGEKAFTVAQAKTSMFMKSGAKTEVWMLADGLGKVYASYRNAYATIMQQVLKHHQIDEDNLRTKVTPHHTSIHTHIHHTNT
jgi:hypothetical protein